MELLTLITSFLVAVSFLLDHAELTQLSLPRKLNFHEERMKACADEDCTPHKNFEQPLSDTKQHEKGKKGMNAGRVFEEGPNKSEYFTMDYGWVRRRRPIHNKQIPYVP